jgi:hypothetical protein
LDDFPKPQVLSMLEMGTKTIKSLCATFGPRIVRQTTVPSYEESDEGAMRGLLGDVSPKAPQMVHPEVARKKNAKPSEYFPNNFYRTIETED